MGFFEAIGLIVSTVCGLTAGWLVLTILGNIYGGIRGAYRLRRIRTDSEGKPPFGHWMALKFGLHCWYGRRYDGNVGEYWQINGMQVPMDGRDKIRHDRLYGS
jgi:hypothetical protein